MKISDEEKRELEEIYQAFLHDEKILRMKEISMHRGSNCYILHDYYLYDWRNDHSKMEHHLSAHPYIAAENAERDFGIHEPIKKVIKSHMWPVNFADFPKTKEARIITLADKHIYIKEIVCSKRYKEKREAKYLRQISTLFGK